MNSERWKKIEEVYNAAVELEIDQRTVFLAKACSDDDSLRSQVESLLGFEKEAENFIESPAFELSAKAFVNQIPKIKTGQVIDNYKIERLLGSGGMGEVYLAEDIKLGRKVALKMLASQLVADETSRKRFLREARLASSLEHANICGIHEIGESDGLVYISMQFVEGKTLGEVIGGAPLALESVLSIGAQIADALDAAHSHGIIHRDIKSNNILVTSHGQVKVLDFGLAKSIVADGDNDNKETKLTQTGVVKGTPAYMSPEQARGENVDFKSDIFSFGVVLYEMITGQLPFKKRSKAETMNAIINEPPARISEIIKDVPSGLSTLIDRTLEKEPSKRLSDISAARDELAELMFKLSGSDSNSSGGQFAGFKPFAVRHRNRLGTRAKSAIALIVLLIIAGGAYGVWSYSNKNWAQNNINEVEELVSQRRAFAAFDLAVKIEAILPGNEELARLMPKVADEFSITSEPIGANVYLKRFLPNESSEFPRRELIGQTPIAKFRVARGSYVLNVESDGYAPVSRTISFVPEQMGPMSYNLPPIELSIKLNLASEIPERSVYVPGGNYSLVSWRKPTSHQEILGDFLIDKFEVSNREFKEFVTTGGYFKKEFWKHDFVIDGKKVDLDEAIEKFKDQTGLPSPRSWSNQTFPEGKADHPVTDISWYEAAAYAEFRGKSLPSIYQWEKAARDGLATYGTGSAFPWGRFQDGDSLEFRANFLSKDTVPVDRYEFGMSPFGVYNMAGNVTEWMRNEINDGFAAAGGSWGEPHYGFGVFSDYPGFYSSNKVGFRCAKNLNSGEQGGQKIEAAAEIPVYKPTSETEFRSWKQFYRYDKSPLEAKVVETKETDEWIREKITFIGADEETAIAYLYLPKNFKRPVSVIQYVPAADVYWKFSSLPSHVENFMSPYIKSGRAVFSVVQKGFIERERAENYVAPPKSSIKFRDEIVSISTDLSRGLDYLETRDDIDKSNIIYWGYSKGAELGLIMTAIDKRYISAVFIGGGLWDYHDEFIAEADPKNFASHIDVPKLMVNGKYDEQTSWETEGKPLFELLKEPKTFEYFDGGHTPPHELVVPIIVRWLDSKTVKAQPN